jgi:uncharacterized protein YndB with AHSA1/START domain
VNPPRPLSVGHAQTVAAPPERVWELLADPTRRPSWMTELSQVDAAPGTVSVGDRFDGESAILLHRFLGSSQVVEVETHKALAEEVVIGARFVSRWELVPSTDGRTTSIRHTIDVEFPSGPFSPVERWILRRRLLRMQRASLRNLSQRF